MASTLPKPTNQNQATEPQQGGALVQRVTKLAASLPQSPTELVDRIREIRQQAHVLSPAVTAASIPEHIKINAVVEVIDTTIDPRTGRGADVYFQASIHKFKRQGRGDEAETIPLECSLSATTLKRILAAAGVTVTESAEIPTGNPYHWKWQSKGRIRDFDGSWRDLPPGTAEVDLRDGSAQIGEWTPEEWAKREAEAKERAAKLPADQRWKAKPESINGWSYERVMSARRYGLRLAEAKSLNALARNLGLKQVYTIDELRTKPFVIFRATFAPDMSDPVVRHMVHAKELGALDMLYPPAQRAAELPPVSAQDQPQLPEDAASTTMTTGDELAERDFDEIEAEEAAPPQPRGHVVKRVTQDGQEKSLFWVQIETGQRLLTDDRAIAKSCNEHRKTEARLEISAEEVTFRGEKVAKILEVRMIGTEDKGL